MAYSISRGRSVAKRKGRRRHDRAPSGRRPRQSGERPAATSCRFSFPVSQIHLLGGTGQVKRVGVETASIDGIGVLKFMLGVNDLVLMT